MGSAVIPDNDDPADDKVYYFFTERVTNMEGGNKAVYTRVARVCAVWYQTHACLDLWIKLVLFSIQKHDL